MQSSILLLSILGCIYIVYGLECYDCDSSTNSACGDPFNASGLNGDNKCDEDTFIACVKVKMERNGIFSISRSGTNISDVCSGDVNGCQSQNLNGATSSTCCCTTNLCNGASSLQNLSVISMVIILPIVLAYQWI
ncbi:unnamed protein product [Rotaria magnacalcarata]|uniref:Protein sleepless n=1 Tax=Rotaria magnacalcarata TaxID=392030 RepID=A0A815CM43_9BILA|nr:unnamed protein product [Rotaria magnacalcarata]CAF1650623.1 unnamed protein product [Rotaria magnacalcarata]CAF1956640.1 unnamed protein product [Rotaria magnacalcarata]CAF2011044.1 unnamed protein product [Rotaria magnacalcarata]CAF2215185.1 unnamed protein product [Rotaria magnacalcarata]